MLPALLEDLKKAERYIFMEYFIIDEGIMWGEILGHFGGEGQGRS